MPTCRVCGKSFGILRSRHHCAFCSLALCSGCLSKDVIVFANGTASAVHIAVIKVVGVRQVSVYLCYIIHTLVDSGLILFSSYSLFEQCPEKEPDICMYLKTCVQCKGKLEEHQISKEHENIQLDELSERQMIWKEIVEVEKKLMSIQTKIDKHLPEVNKIKFIFAGFVVNFLRVQKNCVT